MKNENIYVVSENLSENMVAEGTVKKFPVYVNEESDEITEISILELSPGARIKFHMHQTDSEIYFLLGSKEYKCVPLGEGHTLNNSTNKTMSVVSIKSKKDLRHTNKVEKMFPYLFKHEEEEHFSEMKIMMRDHGSIII